MMRASLLYFTFLTINVIVNTEGSDNENIGKDKTKEERRENKDASRQDPKPVDIFDIALWKTFEKSIHDKKQPLRTFKRFLQSLQNKKMFSCSYEVANLDRIQNNVTLEFCGILNLLTAKQTRVITFEIHTKREEWHIYLSFEYFDIPYSYKCAQSYLWLDIDNKYHCGKRPPWNIYTGKKKVQLKFYQYKDESQVSKIRLYFEAYSSSQYQVMRTTPKAMIVHQMGSDINFQPPKNDYLMLIKDSEYFHYSVHFFALYDEKIQIQFHKVLKHTVQIYDGPDDNVPQLVLEKSLKSSAFALFLTAQLTITQSLIVSFKSVQNSAHDYLENGCSKNIQVGSDVQNITHTSNFSTIPFYCMHHLVSKNGSINVEMQIMNIQSDGLCKGAGIIVMDIAENGLNQYLSPICSSTNTVRWTSKKRKVSIIFYNFYFSKFDVTLFVKESKCIGIDTTCTASKELTILPVTLDRCIHLYSLPHTQLWFSRTCSFQVTNSNKKTMTMSVHTGSSETRDFNNSETLSITYSPPTDKAKSVEIGGKTIALSGRRHVIVTGYSIIVNFTNTQSYVIGGYFATVEIEKCVKADFSLKESPPGYSMWLFDQCGEVFLPFVENTETFYIMHKVFSYFKLDFELVPSKCTSLVNIDVTEIDILGSPKYKWKSPLSRFTWKTSGTLIAISISNKAPPINFTSCNVNMSFLSYTKERPIPMPNNHSGRCILKPPKSDKNNVKELSFYVKGPKSITWRDAKHDCETQGGILMDLSNGKRVSYLLQILEEIVYFPHLYAHSCHVLAKTLWETPAVLVGLSSGLETNYFTWSDKRTLTEMHWWSAKYDTLLYPQTTNQDKNKKEERIAKFSEPYLQMAQIEPAKQKPNSQKQCAVLVIHTLQEDPLWLPISCDIQIEASYVCQNHVLQNSNDIVKTGNKSEIYTCRDKMVLFDKHCYALLTVYLSSNVDVMKICEPFSSIPVLNDSDTDLTDLLLMFKYDPKTQGYIWGIHSEMLSKDSKDATHVLCGRGAEKIKKLSQVSYFTCNDGSYIVKLYVCDGNRDCKHGEDENKCDNTDIEQHRTSLYFDCQANGQHIAFSLICNGIFDCENGADEHTSICTRNLRCMHYSRVCDGILDCPDGRDEYNCKYCNRMNCSGNSCMNTMNVRYSPGWCRPSQFTAKIIPRNQVCKSYGQDYSPCSYSENHCFPRSKACILEHDLNGGVLHCPNGDHIKSCEKMECPEMFKCPLSYCIPHSKVCDGLRDCISGEDELDCGNHCVGKLQCRTTNQCLSNDQICDGITDCPHAEDEEMCTSKWCPKGCLCTAHAMHCNTLKTKPQLHTFPPGLVSISMTRGRLTALDFARILFHLKNLLFLNLSNNRISMLHKISFRTSVLVKLNVENNKIHFLSYYDFIALPYLEELRLHGNPIVSVGIFAFSPLMNLETLDLYNLGLNLLSPYILDNMISLTTLNMSSNDITYIRSYVFSGARQLKVIDLRFNPIINIDPLGFYGIWMLDSIHMPEFKFCCLVKRISFLKCKCLPEFDKRNVFSSCDDLLSNIVLRVSIWITGGVGIAANLFSVVWRRQTDRRTAFSFMVQNLGIADCLMGSYLLIIGGADLKYRQQYYLHEEEWKSSPLCRVAGFTSMLSCEMSIFILVLITIDRIKVVGLCRKGIGRKTTRFIIMVGWVIWLSLSILPISGIDYFGGKTFIKHGVCFLFNLSEQKTKGWEFETAIFVVYNLSCILIICIGYTFVFISIRKRSPSYITSTMNLAQRLSIVVVSNCICWFPPIICCVVALNNLYVHPKVITWIAVLIMPLNSSLNPFLYTLSFKHIKSKCLALRKRKMKKDSSLADSLETQDAGKEKEDKKIDNKQVVKKKRGKAVPFRARNTQETLF